MTPLRANPEAGFTLIEVLVGVTLLAMLATMIASGTRMGGRAWNSAERQTTEIDDMDAVQGLLRRTIARARPAFASADPADMRIDFAGGPDALSFVSTQPGTQDNGPWMRERLYVARSGQTRALFMSWQPRPAPSHTEAAAVLLDHVAAVRFAYFGSARPGDAPVWVDQWSGQDRLPQLVRVSIERDGAAFARWPELVVATRITANAGCVFDARTSTCGRTP